MKSSAFKYNRLVKSFNEEDQRGLIKITAIVFTVVALLITTQKFFEFGSFPDYKVSNSLIFNFLMLVPFSIWMIPVIEIQKKVSTRKPLYYWTLAIMNTILLFLTYCFVINTILYFIGFSSTLISDAFFAKYFSGAIQIHLVALLFVQLFLFLQKKGDETEKKEEQTAIFNIASAEILWIEAFDHYVKIFTSDNERVVKRAKMKKLEKDLPSSFVRIHRKYIVNTAFVERIRNKERALYVDIGEKSLRVSRSNITRVKTLFNSRQK